MMQINRARARRAAYYENFAARLWAFLASASPHDPRRVRVEELLALARERRDRTHNGR